ncbi:MAG: nucleotide kinase [Methanospirillum sp.]|uniref:nucleoside-triphosphatase n=1 Tax=Methanospirillum sp. TaxID=45200 RepID=UPI0023739569|nr:nucleoside-triphosphatase [Methanospirillum sp.]MDD1727451.1 nucleotide kinase [Methanospirillum sp.]
MIDTRNNDISIPASRQPPVYIISGEQAEGKTTFLMEMLDRLRTEEVRMRGIVAPGYFKDGARSGFSVVDLGTGISEELCSTTPDVGSEQHARFFFRPEGLSFGNRAILDFNPETTDILVIDEVGRFDVQGAVWGGSIDILMKQPHPPMVWTVRREFVGMVTTRWPIRPVVRELGLVSIEQFTEEIMKEIRIYQS